MAILPSFHIMSVVLSRISSKHRAILARSRLSYILHLFLCKVLGLITIGLVLRTYHRKQQS